MQSPTNGSAIAFISVAAVANGNGVAVSNVATVAAINLVVGLNDTTVAVVNVAADAVANELQLQLSVLFPFK